MYNKQILVAQQLLDAMHNAPSLSSAMLSIGLDKGQEYVLFPQGIISALESLTNNSLQNIALEGCAGVTHKISLLLLSKVTAYPSYFAYELLKLCNMKLAWEASSFIWYLAGDRSCDINYYTKRSLLVGVYRSALKFYVQDLSEDKLKLQAIIDKKLRDVVSIGKKLHGVRKAIEKIPILRLWS